MLPFQSDIPPERNAERYSVSSTSQLNAWYSHLLSAARILTLDPDLDGIQIHNGWSLVANWSKAFQWKTTTLITFLNREGIGVTSCEVLPL